MLLLKKSWYHLWPPGAHKLPCSGKSTQMSCTSWGFHIINLSNDPENSVFLEAGVGGFPSDLGDETFWGIYYLVNWGHVPRSFFQVLPYLSDWVISFGDPWYFVVLTKYSEHSKGVFMTFLGFLYIIPFLDNLIILFKVKWFSLWFQTSISISYSPKGILVESNLAVPPLLRLAQENLFPIINNLIEFVMFSKSELGGILPPPGYLLKQKSEFSGNLPLGTPWWSPPRWKTVGLMPLDGTSQLLQMIGTPFNPPPWEHKALMGYQNRFPRLVPRQVFAWMSGFWVGFHGKDIARSFVGS